MFFFLLSTKDKSRIKEKQSYRFENLLVGKTKLLRKPGHKRSLPSFLLPGLDSFLITTLSSIFVIFKNVDKNLSIKL